MIVDSHVHVYRTAEQGRGNKDEYEIHEYGRGEPTFGDDAGTIEELGRQMDRASVDRAFVVNLFATRPVAGGGAVCTIPGDDAGREVVLGLDEARAELAASNRWCMDLPRVEPRVVPLVTVDPALMQGAAMRGYVADCVAAGARGVKLHALVQGYHAGDARLFPAYDVLQAAGLPVVAHSGVGRGEQADDAIPAAFAAVAEAFPALRLVLAHLGGGAWSGAAELARRYPSVAFDCCEIVAWLGGERAPTAVELARVILDVGVERVLLGSDYPWYDLDDTVNRVLELPLLTDDDKARILGANAQALVGGRFAG